MPERGCGRRTKGGVYAECPLSPFGTPIEAFLVEPPIEIDRQSLGLSEIGVKLLDKDGITNIYDWVGERFYPNVADFVEEVRVMGLSRRLPRTLDFARITQRSRIVLIHRRAMIRNWQKLSTEPISCPKGLEHKPDFRCCVGAWWHDVTPLLNLNSVGVGVRAMPSFNYTAHDAQATPTYGTPAIFMWLPVNRLAVIRDPEGGTHEAAADAAAQAGVPMSIEDE